MATEAKGSYKQDMVVSMRYRNDLPPPPMPPKLLNIDTGGIQQYLTPGFAAAMARREEPNIEADAEGGMPIDMIGIPGYFLGDESAIMAPDVQPMLDPADEALMATPDQLRNLSAKASNVSFLRRTQYISSGAAAKNDAMLRSTTIRPKPIKSFQPAQETQLSKDDPVYIKRYIQKGFDIAYPESKQIANDNSAQTKGLPATAAEIEAWRNPIHPDNHKLKPLDFYPLLPDLEGFPETGAYASIKFDKAPLPATDSGRRDERIDVSLLQVAVDEAAAPAYNAKLAAYEADPDHYAHPGEQPLHLGLHLAKDTATVPRVKAALNESSDSQSEQFDYQRHRIYNIANSHSIQENPYRSMVLTLFDPSSPSTGHSRLKDKDQKAAYYYPLAQIMKLRANVAEAVNRGAGGRKEATAAVGVSDAVMLSISDPDEDRLKLRTGHRAAIDSIYRQEWEEKYPKEPTPEAPVAEGDGGDKLVERENGDVDIDADGDGDGDVSMTGTEERALRTAVAGVVGEEDDEDEEDDRNGGGGDLDAEGEADDSE